METKSLEEAVGARKELIDELSSLEAVWKEHLAACKLDANCERTSDEYQDYLNVWTELKTAIVLVELQVSYHGLLFAAKSWERMGAGDTSDVFGECSTKRDVLVTQAAEFFQKIKSLEEKCVASDGLS